MSTISSAAVELALMKLPEYSHATARMSIVGAAKMGKLKIKHLAAKGCTKIVRLFIDIFTPRNVGSYMSDLETGQVYNVNGLNEVVASNTEDRLQKVMEAQVITEDEVKEFEAWNDSL
ncbi:unnamed protein product [Fraxinus pennsylvanica]|uniref:Uncharacterized protein n=1 Tax=Fraxinus pennsylvanica TaxID=56036 RepID=A0AAD2DUI2_9LAMI|nr:unnamed protein product [Fraxinus pennsylvanica]